MLHNLKSLNKASTKIFKDLISGLEPRNFDGTSQSHRRIGGEIGGGQTYMPVCVECINENTWGQVFSIAHYYKQNSDLMADPDMEFLVEIDGEGIGGVYPLTFYQASLGQRDVGAWFEVSNGEEISNGAHSGDLQLHSRYYKQLSLAKFANQWMKNIKVQQSDYFKGVSKRRAKAKREAKKLAEA